MPSYTDDELKAFISNTPDLKDTTKAPYLANLNTIGFSFKRIHSESDDWTDADEMFNNVESAVAKRQTAP